MDRERRVIHIVLEPFRSNIKNRWQMATDIIPSHIQIFVAWIYSLRLPHYRMTWPTRTMFHQFLHPYRPIHHIDQCHWRVHRTVKQGLQHYLVSILTPTWNRWNDGQWVRKFVYHHWKIRGKSQLQTFLCSILLYICVQCYVCPVLLPKSIGFAWYSASEPNVACSFPIMNQFIGYSIFLPLDIVALYSICMQWKMCHNTTGQESGKFFLISYHLYHLMMSVQFVAHLPLPMTRHSSRFM